MSHLVIEPVSTGRDSLHSADSRPGTQTIGLLELGPADPWNLTTESALLLLVFLWGWKFYSTWAAWGNLTVDTGHEMYLPALLAEGKMLYRDVWFNFGPAAPYFNSYLFRLFGANLTVLYWAGSLSALASAVLLYLAGMKLSSWKVGWTAGAVLLMESFQPSIFCFPLPYSFSAVYGCVMACLFLYAIIQACASAGLMWISVAGMAAAIALLLKPEFGIACYLTLLLLVGLRGFRKRDSIAKDLLAILPGIVFCVAVIRWMISIHGVDFIIHENIQSWPTSFFMKTYGKFWLRNTGFSLDATSVKFALIRSLFVAAVLLELHCLLKWRRFDFASVVARLTLFAGLIAYYIFIGLNPEMLLSALVFPPDMVLYVVIAGLVLFIIYWREILAESREAAVPLALAFSGLLAFRIMLQMSPAKYSIYYNGPVVLCFLWIAFLLIRRQIRTPKFVLTAELLVCLTCLLSVGLYARRAESVAKGFVPLATGRGTVRVLPHLAETYQTAIAFMKQRAALGEYVLSIPEDTSLYFLSGTYCPTRVFLLIPGTLAPGKMTNEFIQEIEQKPVRYVLWSNRTFWEYGVPIFGRDFDQTVANYLISHYHPVGPLPPSTPSPADWNAQILERNE